MSATKTNPGQALRFGTFGPWITIAAVAVLAGLVMPQMIPGSTDNGKSIVKSETKDKEKNSLEYTPAPLPEIPNFQAMMLRLGLGTITVLGLCVFSLWGMRQWMNPTAITGSNERVMRLMETLQLGNRCSLHLVQLGNREVIVGVDSTGIKTVLPLAAAFDDVLAQAETTPAAVEQIKATQLAA